MNIMLTGSIAKLRIGNTKFCTFDKINSRNVITFFENYLDVVSHVPGGPFLKHVSRTPFLVEVASKNICSKNDQEFIEMY